MKNINIKKKVMFGKKVSNSNLKTKRRFYTNKNSYRLNSEILKNKYKIIASKKYIKTLKLYGGIDAYLIKTPSLKLTPRMIKIKRRVISKIKSIC